MTKLKEDLINLYPNETISESDVQSMADSLTRFFTLCVQIAEREQSPQKMQGSEQNVVQNANFMG